ncbi:hypothetical protein V9T40_002032 [Parthenolecanium corni]|uniref:Poly(A) polymerase n=1 Tax=Parthenolecanium corni TaxID=536013 RepID=A0AAN9Y3R1_9HEMI
MWTNEENKPPEGAKYGVTAPISESGPKPIDNEKTLELETVLNNYDNLETEEELNHRMEILARLNDMVNEWVIELAISQNMPEEIAASVGGRITTFGSYRLGVHSKGSDIDALCIAPRHVTRADYFTSFFEKLKDCSEVKELRKVEEAFVPLIRMNFDGIEIDLLFAQLLLSHIPEELDLRDDSLLRNLDPKCVRSLNGCRVTDEIINVVPNVDTFRLALRAIKLWAKRHGIYSNILGYLGGVSWAMLVARTCQLYPNAVAATIIQKFFFVYSQWKWPTPVLLKKSSNPNLNFPVWNPQYSASDRSHLMPIITPAYPQQNSTYNVSKATLSIMKEEFIQGMQLVEEIMIGRRDWTVLFQKPVFFAKYKHFIMLLASSHTNEEHLRWTGLLEAKIRHLVAILERNMFIETVHVNPSIFKLRQDFFKVETADGIHFEELPNSLWFIGLKFGPISYGSINLTREIQKFTDEVMKHANNINMYQETMKIEAKYVKRKNLGDYISNEIIDEDKKGFAGIPMSVKNGATELLRRNGTTPPSSNSSVVSVSSNGNSYSNAVPVNSTRRVTVVNAAIPVSSGGSSSGSNSNSSSPESNSRSEPSTRSAPSPPVSECSPKSESSSPRAESSSSKRPSDSPDEVAVRPPTRRRLNGYIVRSPPVVEEEIVEFIDLTEDEVTFVSSS